MKGGGVTSAIEIKKGIYWVGAIDWNIRFFHGPAYSTHRGTTYNCYLIVDKQVTLVDTVYHPFAGELLRNIQEVLGPRDIDFVVINHVETDHSGSLPEIMKAYPLAKVFCTRKGMEGLRKHYFGEWNYEVVKTGDTLPTGERTLSFIEVPMLHWPDSMFSYLEQEALLMPNDAFGQHLATSHRFDDEVDINVVMDESAKYYANILMPFSSLVLKKLDEVGKLGLRIDMIAPSHGIIWRKRHTEIIDAYARWARGETRPKAVIVYDTMWGSTEKMAQSILDGLAREGVSVQLFRMSAADRNDIIKELLDARALLVGSPTINRDMLPNLAPFLEDLRGLKPLNKVGVAFGSFGWGGGAVKAIEERLRAAGIEVAEGGLELKWVPTGEELAGCYELGRRMAGLVRRTT